MLSRAGRELEGAESNSRFALSAPSYGQFSHLVPGAYVKERESVPFWLNSVPALTKVTARLAGTPRRQENRYALIWLKMA